MSDQPPDGLGASLDQPHIAKIPVDPACKERALEKIRDAVKGNGFDPAKVELKTFEGEVLRFAARTILNVRTHTHEKTVAGQKSGPQNVNSEQGLKEAIDREYAKFIGARDTAKHLREIVLNREDRGFAQDNVIIPLNFYRKDFVYYEPCKTCNAVGTMRCQRCRGKGDKTCSVCRGSSNAPCPHCNGAAWFSKLTTLEMDIRTKFEYEESIVPTKVAILLDELKHKLDKHAIIHAVQLEKIEALDEKEGIISLHYEVELPYGHFEFTLGRETYYSFLFGHDAKLTYTSDFLDKIIANGARKLKDAAEYRGNIMENLHAAAQYKTVKQAIIAAAKFPSAKASKLLLEITPLGLSKVRAEELIKDSDTALKNITQKPRNIGLGIALISTALFYHFYFMTGLRIKLMSLTRGEIFHGAIDTVMLVVGCMLASIIVQLWSLHALKKILSGLLPQNRAAKIMPKTGQSGIIAYGGACILFIAFLEISYRFADSTPVWYEYLHRFF